MSNCRRRILGGRGWGVWFPFLVLILEIGVRQITTIGYPFGATRVRPHRKRVTAGSLSFAAFGLARAFGLPQQTPASVLAATQKASSDVRVVRLRRAKLVGLFDPVRQG